MNYGQLKTYVLADAHRTDLTSEVAAFIRRAEGMIRRELVGYELKATIDDDERDTAGEGIYTLPSGVLVLRGVFTTSNSGASYAVENVGAANIRELPASAPVLQYAVRGPKIEFRGVPGTSQSIELHYFGHPDALSDDADENDLLTDHEELYVSGAQFHLYKFTQDLELAQGALDTFTDAIEKLNDAHARKVGGASNLGAYNFGQRFPSGSSM